MLARILTKNLCDLATDSPQTDTIKQQSDLRPRVARAKVLARVGIRNRPRNSLLPNQQYVFRFYIVRNILEGSKGREFPLSA